METMLCHRDILQGVPFKWVTDHKGLIHLLNQKNLLGRWMEKVGEFDIEILYVPGSGNVLADALFWMYSNDSPGTVRSRSEYTYHDVVSNEALVAHNISMPLLVGLVASAALPQGINRLRPETAAQFAKRMKTHFVLKGPRE